MQRAIIDVQRYWATVLEATGLLPHPDHDAPSTGPYVSRSYRDAPRIVVDVVSGSFVEAPIDESLHCAA